MSHQFLQTSVRTRVTRVPNAVRDNTLDELKDKILEFEVTNEGLRERRWQNTLNTIVMCVAMKRKANDKGDVGSWLTDTYPNMHRRIKARIVQTVKYCTGIYRGWKLVVHKLTNTEMKNVDPRDFTLRKLYDARKKPWCDKEKNKIKQNF